MPQDASTHLHCFSGTYALEKPAPTTGSPTTRAWDAADESLLSAAAPLLDETTTPRVLVVNDRFGALALGLHASQPHSWGDSFTARWALEENLRRNSLPPETVAFVPATTAPPGKDRGAYDIVLWRVPKARALFEQQLTMLQPRLRPETIVLAGGMVKHLLDSAKSVLGALGTVSVDPVWRKAVVLRLTPHLDAPPLPAISETPLFVPEYGLELVGGPGIFAHGKFDDGARFFLEQFPRLPGASRIADLGCGNGVLGIVAGRLQPGADVHFFDESYQAVAAAEQNHQRNNPAADQSTGGGTARFSCDDVLTHYDGDAFDLILCNPPFHETHEIGDQTAWRMFTQSKRHLRPGGELWIVGNRHLEYHVKLRRVFGNCRQIASNPKFVVLAATRRP